jgi:predicted metal-binding protein
MSSINNNQCYGCYGTSRAKKENRYGEFTFVGALEYAQIVAVIECNSTSANYVMTTILQTMLPDVVVVVRKV